MAVKNEEIDATPMGEGKKLDRNELLKILNSKNQDQ
jgi:Zn-finger nucleic acid-binding protein